MFTNSASTLRLRKGAPRADAPLHHNTINGGDKATEHDSTPTDSSAQTELPEIPPPEVTTMSTKDSGEAPKPQRQIHTVKLDKDHFENYKKKKLTAQTRLNDRHYREGDILIQREWDGFLLVHTGRELISTLTAVTTPPGLAAGYVLLHTRALA